MKIIKISTGLIVAFSAMLLFVGCEQQMGSKKEVKLESELDSVSYAIGIDIAGNIKKSGFEDINTDAIAKGFEDIFNENETLLDPADANQYVMNYFNKVKERKAEKNLQEAEEFLKENADKEKSC